jgi:hypothetical protein
MAEGGQAKIAPSASYAAWSPTLDHFPNSLHNSAGGFLRQNALGGHFPDVGGGEVNTVVEAILQLRQFDPLGIDGGNPPRPAFLGT